MKFKVEDKVFEKLPNLYIGVVVAKNIDNTKDYPEVKQKLADSIKVAESRFLDKKVKEDQAIIPYREAFSQLGMNPNKFQCSVEALFTRISKGKKLPSINPLVDLNNAVSLKHTLPMGTHDLSRSSKDIEMRYAREGDTFVPMGSNEVETPDTGEVVYAVGDEVRTRRWAWRQSDFGKITPDTSYVFFPIDGFIGVNEKKVDKAAQELAKELERIFNCKTVVGHVDASNPEFAWD
ncbi:hypothetical protein IKD67_00325 [Candidatus Saccharibacteria bacterium]|nr:hypothetical protein [Candidatus Saccharibacteria bacterium]